MKKYISFIIRLILGLTFILTGILKSIDPMGLTYKIEEFLIYISLENWVYFSKALSIIICSVELSLGLLLLLDIKKSMTGKFAFIVMLFFTLFTFYLLLKPNVLSDCGCFGDAIHLSHTSTFGKNIILLLLSIINLFMISPENTNCPNRLNLALLILAVIVYSTSISFYSLQKLPSFDFLPYNTGTDLRDNPSFIIFDDSLNIVTPNYIAQDKHTLLLIVRRPEKLANSQEKILRNLISFQEDSLNIVIIGNQNINQIKAMLPAISLYDIAVYQADGILLKSLLRCDNGIILIQKGIIKGKWNISSFTNKKQYTIDEMKRNIEIKKWLYTSWILLGFIALLFFKLKFSI